VLLGEEDEGAELGEIHSVRLVFVWCGPEISELLLTLEKVAQFKKSEVESQYQRRNRMARRLWLGPGRFSCRVVLSKGGQREHQEGGQFANVCAEWDQLV
jgi:hypothetical protein